MFYFLYSFFCVFREYNYSSHLISVFPTYYKFFVWIFVLFLAPIYGSSSPNNNVTCFNPSSFFNCTDGFFCIPIAHRCNHAIDCQDGSDEINCNISGRTHVCATGYKWSHLGCVDIDECQEFLSCSQICTNTLGSFSCACVQGYDLDTVSGTFCRAPAPLPYILVTAGDSIFSLYPDSDPINYFTEFSKNLYLSHLEGVTAVGFHFRKQLVFWSDVSRHGLYKDSLLQIQSDVNPYHLISPMIHDVYMRPVSIAVDWVSDKLYWADDLNGRIEVSELDGTNRRVLISGLVKPTSLAIDPEWGYLFILVCDPFEPKILRSNMDGSNVIILHNSTLMFPSSLTVDLPTHTLYWIDAGLGGIERSAESGLNRHVVVSDRNQIHDPTSISVYEDTIYFTDSFIWGIVAVHKDGSRNRQIARRIDKALSLQIVHPSLQPDLTSSSPCALNNGGCHHLCLLSNSSSHSCLCPTLRTPYYDPQLGVTTCLYPDQFMLAVTASSMRAISIQGNFVEAQLDTTPFSNVARVVWDDLTESLFWSSGLDGCIHRYQLGRAGKESQTIFQDKLIRISDMAYDWIHSLLFFIDETNKRIEVVSVDNPSLRSVVIPHGLHRPRSIVVNPLRGYIAWIDANRTQNAGAVIMIAGMDGSNQRTLVSRKLADPTILTVDYRSDYLYWFDRRSGCVEITHFDGTRGRTIMSTHYTISTFSVYKGNIFWSPEEVERIFRYNPSTRTNATIMTGLPGVSHLSIYYQRSELTSDFNTPCSTSQTNCSHLCVLRGSLDNLTNSACMCRNGYELSNGLHCVGKNYMYAIILQENDLYYSAIQDYSLRTLHRVRAQNITSLALDPTDPGIVFIAENSLRGGVIKRLAFDKASHPIINSTILYSHFLGCVSEIVIEPRTRLLYWLDSLNGVIGVGSATGDKRTIILGQGLFNPKFILLDVNSSRLYWVELRISGSFISSMSLDGSNKQRVKAIPDKQITSFALAILLFDGENVHYLLWTIFSSPNIYCYELELDFTYFIPTSSSSPDFLAVHEPEVYWSARDTNTIYRAVLNPGNPPYLSGIRTIFTSELTLSGVKIESYLDKHYPPSPCTHATTCSYLCLPSPPPQGYSCQCPTGIVPLVDAYCPRLPSRFLLISLHSEIHYVSLDTSYTAPTLLYSESQLVTGAADMYAPSETNSALIWSDITNRKSWAIKKMEIGSETISVLVRGVFTRGLAVDQRAGKLYYTDRFNHSIMAYDLETGLVLSLVTNGTSQNVLKPRSLAIDPTHEYLFWSDWGIGTLERSRLDGSERKVLIAHHILEPSGLTIDLLRQRLYWVDYAYKTIESCDYEGMNRLTIAKDLSQPYSITLSYPDLYFTDWTNNTLNRISLLNPASAYNTTYQSTSIIMDVQFIDVNENLPFNTLMIDPGSVTSTASTISHPYNSTTSYLLQGFAHGLLFTILYCLAALLTLLILVLLLIFAHMYCNLRRLKRRRAFSPHSALRNSTPPFVPHNIAFTDAIFSLTNNSPISQQQSPPKSVGIQTDNIPTATQGSDPSHISLDPILTPSGSASHGEAACNASSIPEPTTAISTQDYTPKRLFNRGKACYKLISKFQAKTEESLPLSSFKYSSLSPSKKNSSVYNSSYF